MSSMEERLRDFVKRVRRDAADAVLKRVQDWHRAFLEQEPDISELLYEAQFGLREAMEREIDRIVDQIVASFEDIVDLSIDKKLRMWLKEKFL